MEEPPKATSHQASGHEKTVTVVRGECSLGMTVSALKDGSGLIIRTVVNGGAISKDGRLGVGDGITAINGEPTTNLTSAQARAMLRRHSLTGPDLSLTYVPAAFLDMHRAIAIQSKQESNANRATTTIQLKMDQADAAQSRQSPDTAPRKLGHTSQPTKKDGGRVSRSFWRDQEMEGAVRQTPWGHRHDGAGELGKGGVAPDRIDSQQASRPREPVKDLGNKNMEPALRQKHGDSQAQSRVTLIRRYGESLGISITGGRGMGSRLSNGEVRRGIFIKHIADDSPAARNNMLKVGDRILQVGGVDVSAATHEEVVEAIRQAGVKVQLLVQHQQASITRHLSQDLSQDHHHNRLESDSQNRPILHICPAYPTTPIPFKPTESRLLRKPPQAVLPPLRLPSGPVGTVTDGVTTKNVFERQSRPPETTQHSEQEQASYWSHMLERYGSLPGDLKMVELDCGAHSSGLGVCVTGSRDATHGRMRVYVLDVQRDGAAAADGRIRVGDELLEINGQILYGRSHQNATAIISNARSKAMIVLMRHKMELRHMATGPVIETESSPIVSPSAVGIIMFKEGKHDTVLNQEGKARLEDKHRSYSSEKSIINLHISSSNHKPPSDPVPTFYSSSSSQISPSFSNPLTSHNTAANNTQTIHHTPSLCSPFSNHSGIGVPSSSYCPSCSRSPDLLTRPIIPGCLNTIDICKGMSGLGLAIVGGCNTLLGAIMIQEVNDGGAAQRDGRLMAGDHILEVNGIDLRMATNQEALSVLRLSPHLVRLCVYRHPCAHCTHTFKNPAPYVQEDMWDLFTVDLQIGPRQSLGLSIVGKRNDTGIFVSEITKGGAVEFDGRLLPGDQILSVNGEDIRAVTQDYARTLLQNCRGLVALEMARFKANPHYSYECQVGDSHACPLPSVNIYDALDRNRDTRTVTLEKVSLHLRRPRPHWAAAHTGLLEVIPHTEDGQSASRRSSPDLPEICNTQDHMSSPYQTMSLESGSAGLGITITGGLHSSHGNQPIYIKNVFPKGAAAKDGRLQRGDQLPAVNGRSLRGVTHADAVAILGHAGSTVTLTVLSPTQPTRI